MIYKESPLFVLEAQSLDVNLLSCCSLLNKLASRKLWCPIFLSELSYNISEQLSVIQSGVFTSLSLAQHPRPPGWLPLPGADLRGGSLPVNQGDEF
jgi:hypothetical protein